MSRVNNSEYRRFTSDQEARNWGRDNFRTWWEELSTEERRALSRYTGNGFESVNGLLREAPHVLSNPSMLDIALADIPAIESSLSKIGIPENITSYRGVDWAGMDVPLPQAEGEFIRDLGFVSTSLLESRAREIIAHAQMPVMIEIRVPRGVRGAYIGMANTQDEEEVLLSRASIIRMSSVRIEDGIHRIVGEVYYGQQ